MTVSVAEAHQDDSLEVARIKRRIEDSVAKAFSKGVDAYYLSQLGADLGDDRRLLERLTGRKLSAFIEETFDFEIGKAGIHGNVLFLKNNQPSQDPISSPTPRFKAKFWAAFAIPLVDEQHRFINIQTLEFGSTREAVLAGGEEVREIDASFIAREDEEDTPKKIIDRISSWLSEQGLEASFFVKSRTRPRKEAEASLLDSIIIALSADQLRRVSLPLDVVKSLSER